MGYVIFWNRRLRYADARGKNASNFRNCGYDSFSYNRSLLPVKLPFKIVGYQLLLFQKIESI